MPADLNITLNGTPIPVYLGENTALASARAAVAVEAAAEAEEHADRAEAARDVFLAADVDYPSAAAALAGASNGDFFTYRDVDGYPVYATKTGGVIVDLPGPYFDADKISVDEGGHAQRAFTELLGRSVSLKRFEIEGEPIGTGNAAYDDGAFARAFEYVIAVRRFYDAGYGDLYPSDLIFVPWGDYKTNGNFTDNLSTIGLWAVPNTVTITNEADTYFLAPNQVIDTAYIYGIDFIGGKGGIHHTSTAVNTTNLHKLEACGFFDYTETAICSEAADMPYWRIENNLFRPHPSSGTTTKGVVLGGLMDHLVIRDNAFEGCVIGVQLGPYYSGNVSIQNNSFLSIHEDRTLWDIWFIPTDAFTFGVNAGSTAVQGNKFGPEGRTAASQERSRVLVAAMTGSDRASAEPDLTWKDGVDGANFLTNVIFRDSCITNFEVGGTDGVTGSFIDCYIDKFDLVWETSNRIDLGLFKHLVRYIEDAPGDRQPDFANCRSLIDLGPGTAQYAYGTSFREGVSSHPCGIIRDPMGQTLDPQTFLLGNDPGSTVLQTDGAGANWGAEADITTALVIDRWGNNQATRAIWAVAGRYLYLTVDLTGCEGQRVWVVSDNWTTTDPANAIDFLLIHPDDFHTLIRKRHKPRAIKTPFVASGIVPEHDDQNLWQLRITLPATTAGADTAVFGETIIAIGSSCPRLHRYPLPAAASGGTTQDTQLRAEVAQYRAALIAAGIIRGA